MVKPVILLTFFFVLISVISFGQKKYLDVVTLENDSVVYGIIVETIPNQSITVKSIDGEQFQFDMSDILKISKELKRNVIRKPLNEPGFQGIIKVGYEHGIGTYGIDRSNFKTILNYKLNSPFSVGVGCGINYYFSNKLSFLVDTEIDNILTPIFVNFSYSLNDSNKLSPYISVDMGYTFNPSTNFQSVGYMFNPSIGVSFSFSNYYSLQLECGYSIQQMTFTDYSDVYHFPQGRRFVENSGSLSINTSFKF